MAAIHADPALLWDLYSTISDARAEVSEECEDISRTLEVFSDRTERAQKAVANTRDDLDSQLKEIARKKSIAEEEERSTRTLEAEEEEIRAQRKALDDQEADLKRQRKEADQRSQQFTGQKRECINALRTGAMKVNQYIKILEGLLLEEDFKQYQASAGGSVPGDHGGRYRSMSYRGITFYCNDSEVNPQQTDGKGRTNLARMEQGLAPVGSDGLPVNLHHMQQSATGTVMELSATRHAENHLQLHPNTSNIPSGINRSTFGVLKSAYWKRRAAFIRMSM